MPLIFGKFQVKIPRIDENRQYRKLNNVSAYKNFKRVYGFGHTRIRWLLACVGGWEFNSSNIFYKNKVIYRFKLLSRLFRQHNIKFVGRDLKRLKIRYIRRLMNSGLYRGLRYKARLPINGQRTRSNASTSRHRFIRLKVCYVFKN